MATDGHHHHTISPHHPPARHVTWSATTTITLQADAQAAEALAGAGVTTTTTTTRGLRHIYVLSHWYFFSFNFFTNKYLHLEPMYSHLDMSNKH